MSWCYRCHRVWHSRSPEKLGQQSETRSFTLSTQLAKCVWSQISSHCTIYNSLFVVLGGMFDVAETAAAAAGGINFKLKEGFSAETSGFNLLVMTSNVP